MQEWIVLHYTTSLPRGFLAEGISKAYVDIPRGMRKYYSISQTMCFDRFIFDMSEDVTG
jgi:hypothetical protein